MHIITIRERTSVGSQGQNATISFDGGPLYDITVSDPFAEGEREQALAWYFEEHLRHPYKDGVRAQECAKSITEYGEQLFQQVFRANPDVYNEYQQCISNGLTNVQIEIAGSPAFHGLHWEALKDPRRASPLVLQATMVRKNQTPQNTTFPMRPSTTLNILVVVARPSDTRDVAYRTISRPMVEATRNTNVPVQIETVRPGTYQALVEHLRESTAQYGAGHYHVIHFDLHGAVLSYKQYEQIVQAGQPVPAQRLSYKETYGHEPMQPYTGEKAFLSFEQSGIIEDAKHQTADLVDAATIAALLTEHHIPIAILNACQSGMQVGVNETSLGSRLIVEGVQMVLAMGYSVTVTAARLLMETLYTQLFAKHDLATAIRFARQELYNRKEREAYFNMTIRLEDWLLPVVYQNQPQQLTVRELTPEEATVYYRRKAEREREAPAEPTYGFFGRDIDILHLEKRLLTKRNLVLVCGMGGAGKTTLLHHLRSWWQTTGLVEHVFYFGYDERAWNRQQLLNAIARKLLTPVQYVSFQPQSLEVQQAMLVERLRAEHHLLILDNLESITGTQLAILNTLPEPEQRELHRFLKALVGGKTLVLLGSRSRESWLADHTFADNIYDLPGLDAEAASALAERILERHHATTYRDDPDLLRLLTLLDGFPLALEVILSNLAHQTPTHLLTALQEGNIDLDSGDHEQRTQSIIACITYSHSNLAPESQQLLLCLAPFTSVINENWLKQYTDELKQQPVLAHLPFDRWPEVLQETRHWGLLTPDPDLSKLGYLRLQPTLPYFLRTRLTSPEQAETKAAIETAFRQHYNGLSDALDDLFRSKEPQERLLGQVLIKLEYENIRTALDLALAAHVSILNPFRALSDYLDTTQQHQHAFTFTESVLARLETYPQEQLTGELGMEYVGVIDDIAQRYLLLKHYKQAETMYQKALTTLLASSYENSRKLSASVYHQLGMVAEEQRQWREAESYYQQALQIKVEFNARYEQASTYHQLGIVAQEQRQWKEAESYYQQALQICVEFNARYEQAGTYHQLGRVAQEQEQWEQAQEYFRRALEIYVEYKDTYSAEIALRGFARLWQATRNAQISADVAAIVGGTVEEVEAWFREYLKDKAEREQGKG